MLHGHNTHGFFGMQILEEADLCNASSQRQEVLGLVVAVMVEKNIGPKSRQA